MNNLIRLCLASLIIGLLMSAVSLANSLSITTAQGSEQRTPSPPQTEGDSQQRPTAQSAAPRPNPDASGKYHIGDGVSAPKLIYSVEPEYSERARKEKLNGTCDVALTVDVDGTPKGVHLTRSIADNVSKKLHTAAMELDENCIKTVEKYRFRPAIFQGKPVPVEIKTEVNFEVF